jgi:hypothetical protein
MRFHMHRFRFDSEMENGHKHRVHGRAEHMIGLGSIHMHIYYGVSAYNSHTHYLSCITGLPVKTENGHIHKMEGVLEFNNLHEHRYSGYTFEEISYISGKSYGEAYI